MICQGCKTDGLRVTEMRICWCQTELCAPCLETHTKACTAYANPSTMPREGILQKVRLPPVAGGKGGFEGVMSVMKRMKRRR